jgi:hypothetical protein
MCLSRQSFTRNARHAKTAAEWYRDVLGASIELSRDIDAAQQGMTSAIVAL